MIFIIEILLVSTYEFMLFKLIPLPVNLGDNVYAIIDATSNYLRFDKSRFYFIQITPTQLIKCKHSIDTWICQYEQPLYKLKDTCETVIFRKPQVLPSLCKLKYIKLNISLWHRLETINAWFYVMNKENIVIKRINITTPIIITVNDTGIFTLDNYCEANTDNNTILLPRRRITSSIYLDFVPQLSLNIDFPTHISLTNTVMNKSIFIKENNNIRDN